MAEPNPPLWQAMLDAGLASLFSRENADSRAVNMRLAAELRAIAKEVRQAAKLWSSEEVADWLDMEAERAEAGG